MGNTIIDFEELAVGALVTDQYQAKGVTFVEPPGRGPLPRVEQIASGAKALWIRSGVEVAYAEVKAAFGSPRTTFSATLTNVREHVAHVTLRALDVAGNELASTSTAIPATPLATTTMEISRPASEIHSVLIHTTDTHARFVVDAMAFDEVSSAPGPDFGIRIEHDMPTGLTCRPGASIDAKVVVVRANGSTGELAFAVEGLPNGVTAAFLPPATTGDSTVLRLTATTGVTRSFEQIRVIASPKSPTVGAVARSTVTTLSVVPYFEIPNASASVPPCTLVSIPVEVRIPMVLGAASSWSGTVALGLFDPSTVPAGVTARFVPSTVALSTAAPSATVTLEVRNESHEPKDVAVVVAGQCPPYAAAVATCTLDYVAGQLTGFSPSSGTGPIALQPGTEVVLQGTGHCRGAGGTSVQFGNAKAVAPVYEVADDGRSARVRVPRLATTGKLTRTTPDGAITSTSSFAVTTYRNTHGFSFENLPFVGGVNYGELTDAFGKDQTWVTVSFDPCDGIPVIGWFFDCEIQVSLFPHPFGLVILAIAQGIDAHCFGMSLTSVRMLKGVRSRAGFPPGGATRTWELTGPGGPSEQIRREVFLTSLQQLGSEFLRHWLGASSDVFKPYDVQARTTRDALRAQLAAGELPLIAMRNGGKGHVVVALDVEDATTPNVSYYIHIYDPNVPFLAIENTNATEHEGRELKSRITVLSNGTWQYPGFGGWGPFGFHTVSEGLVVVPYGVTPPRPSFPADPSGMVTLLFGDATTTQLEGSSGRRLLTDDGRLVDDPASRLEAAPMTLLAGRTTPAHGWVMEQESGFVQTLRGTDAGTYRGAILGKGLSVTFDELAVTAMSRDRLEHDGVGRRFGFETQDPSKLLAVKLVASADGGTFRTIGLETTTFAGAGESIRYDAEHDTVVYEHGGPATRCSLELGWMGTDGLPSAFSGEIEVGAGATVVIRPKRWRALEREPVTFISTLPDGSRSQAEVISRAPTIKPGLTLRAKEQNRDFELELETRLPEGEPWSNLVLSWVILDKNKVVQRGSRAFDQDVSPGPIVHTTRFAPRHPGTYELVAYARGIAARLPVMVSGTEARLTFQSQPPGQARRPQR